MAEKQFKPLDLVHLVPDSLNVSGEYVVLDEDGKDVHFTKSIQQAREFKWRGMRVNPGVAYGIFEMRGSWDRVAVPEAAGHILDALRDGEFVD